jgi:hypothetical protein
MVTIRPSTVGDMKDNKGCSIICRGGSRARVRKKFQ